MSTQPTSTRLHYGKAAPEGIAAMEALDTYVDASGLDPVLLDLIRLRASIINGCAYCVDMHTKDLHARGETVERISGLVIWNLAPYYTEKERAALAWTDAVTEPIKGHVSDEVFARARPHFDDKQLVDLTLVVNAINNWNRIVAAFRPV
ncbi:MAG: carboxymuconolactone decarboxylase family protein, partial [bacterium]